MNRLEVTGIEASTTAQVRLGGAWRMKGAEGPLAGVGGLYLSPLLRLLSVESGNDSPEGGGWGELGQARNNGVVGIWGPKVQSSPLAQAVALHTVGPGARSYLERELGLHLTVSAASLCYHWQVSALSGPCPPIHTMEGALEPCPAVSLQMVKYCAQHSRD